MAISKEKLKALKKAAGLDERSLPQKVAESELYDQKPTARYLLNQIAVMAMKEDSNYPEDAPEEYQGVNKVGWCWLSQFKLGLRVGISKSQVSRWIQQYRNDGVIFYRDWYDDNGYHHAEYKVVESVVDAHQRPSQDEDVERPSRYKTKRGANAGSFSAKNQPKKNVIEDEDDA
jgi:hypothetical protein